MAASAFGIVEGFFECGKVVVELGLAIEVDSQGWEMSCVKLTDGHVGERGSGCGWQRTANVVQCARALGIVGKMKSIMVSGF